MKSLRRLAHSLTAKVKMYLLLSVVIFVAVMAFIIGLKFSGGNRVITSEVIRGQLLPASELTTTRYEYTDVASYEDSKDFYGITIPLTTDKSLLVYNGVIGLGYDLKDVKVEVNNSKKTIRIDLPEPSILYHEIDDQDYKVYDIANSIFTEISMDDYKKFAQKLKEKKEKALLADKKTLSVTKENTQRALEQLLAASGDTKGYTVTIE